MGVGHTTRGRRVAGLTVAVAIAVSAAGLGLRTFWITSDAPPADATRRPVSRTLVALAEGAYAWPVKPFDRIHPIRGTFGEPRMWFDGPPTPGTLYGGSGSFSFHDGVDIAASDGAPVYPVRSGVVTLSAACKVFVDTGAGESQQYWHIVTSVRPGDHVVALRTILGRIRKSYGHVHFTHVVTGRAVNPLAAGHLTPYDDHTAPEVGPVVLRRPGTSTEVLPELVRGRVELGVGVGDRSDATAPGMWSDMPTAPAVVTWRVERAADGAVVLSERTALDLRSQLPRRRAFWSTYLRGTRQNMTTFKLHRYWRQPARYLVRLGVLDTRRLRDGIYVVVATATDIAGNAAAARVTFTIFNRRGWPVPTPQG